MDDYWYDISTRFLEIKERILHSMMTVVSSYAKAHVRYKRLMYIHDLWHVYLASDLDSSVCAHYRRSVTELPKFLHRGITQLFYNQEEDKKQDYPTPRCRCRPYPNCLTNEENQFVRQCVEDALTFLQEIDNDPYLWPRIREDIIRKLRIKLEQERT